MFALLHFNGRLCSAIISVVEVFFPLSVL
uniref:Uncharacterized protein n=1 Tax=Rhizophora mucronata TaxID=61149 RepID=A0A2P2NNJ6_RHIMU